MLSLDLEDLSVRASKIEEYFRECLSPAKNILQVTQEAKAHVDFDLLSQQSKGNTDDSTRLATPATE